MHASFVSACCLLGSVLGPGQFVSAETAAPPQAGLVYFNEVHLSQSKAAIASGVPEFKAAYEQLLVESDALLSMDPDPVVDKTIVPPSGNRQDYLSYAPYRWPDETKADGLPWAAKDGVINPVSRGPDTDYVRLQNLTAAVEKLSFAYYFSGSEKYADKVLELVNAWFIASGTRVNPDFRYAQSIPGLPPGNPAGFIDWSRFPRVITAVQLLDQGGVLPAAEKAGIEAWFGRYLDYLLTSPQGKATNALRQNHANWYNVQVVGLMIYLGRLEEAKAKVEDAKTSRIAAQIRPGGEQPLETGRTRSVHYSSMNLWALANLTYMGRQLGIDLWAYESEAGSSLPGGYRYLEPFARHEKPWPFRQISLGGAEAAINAGLRPLFRNTSILLGLDDFGWSLKEEIQRSPLEMLQYPVSPEKNAASPN